MKVFLRTMCAFSILVYSLARFDLADRGVYQSVQPRTFCARLLVYDETLAQPHFAVVNCSDVVMCVFYIHVLCTTWYFCKYELLCQSVECLFL